MSVILIAMLGFAVESGNVIWMDAFEIPEKGFTVSAAGTYHVWVWADASAKSVTVGDKRLKLATPAKGDEAYRWIKAGTAKLAAGTTAVKLEGAIASLALSTRARFDPATVMKDMRVSDQPATPGDGRVEIKRDTNTVFSMTSFASRAEWEAYAEGLRRRLLVSSGLWPLPKRTPLNPHVEAVATHEDYIVEKVHFESRPGVLVTGNLYRPVGDGPFPGVACPHGHWENGRVEDIERGSVPARGITFARMGIVSFAYDMVGYNDSRQFPKHGWEEDTEKLWGIHPFAFQLWNSMRVVDFLESLPYVDKDRLGCTGASGGGTQTFALMAVEPRIKVAAPVNMISHTMQGGCICENSPILRFNASNMEIGALMAPRPLLMVSATGDWTKKTPEVEYPAIRSIYELYGAADRIESIQIDAPHNYNLDSRQAVYRFFGKWLLEEPEKWENFTEPAYTRESVEKLLLFPDGKLPEKFAKKDAFVPAIVEATETKWKAIMPKSPADVTAFRQRYAPALSDALGAVKPEPGTVTARSLGADQHFAYGMERLVIGRKGTSEAIPALLYYPTKGNTGSVVLVHGQGKAALANPATGGPGEVISQLLARHKLVLAIDVFLVGEHQDPRTGTERHNGKFPDTFLPTDAGYRVQDVLTVIAYCRSILKRDWVEVAGLGAAGPWCLFASALDGRTVSTIIDADGFNPQSDQAWVDRCYVPWATWPRRARSLRRGS
jgi:acetyl xylan esterase AXE1